MELLLSYLEFRQYELMVSKIFDIEWDDDILRVFKGVPTSEIITKYNDTTSDLNNETKIKHIAYELYVKFIKDGSTFQININYGTRNYLRNLLDNENEWMMSSLPSNEYLNLFKNCCKEMYRLLGFSLSRALNRNEIVLLLQQSLK